MQFIKANKLKIGMRLARPIYNNQGVLLFERDSKLTPQAIESVRNFDLLGVYILDPSEPVPPMSEEDLEFERFQTMAVFSIREELENILEAKRIEKLPNIADMILKNYGHKDEKINFCQSLRSREDYVYKHSLNVAMLCALITHNMKLKREEQQQIVMAAIIHDLSKLMANIKQTDADNLTETAQEKLKEAQTEAMTLIERIVPDGVNVRRVCSQAWNAYEDFRNGIKSNAKVGVGARVLLVANRYDEVTAMNMDGSADSEVKALQEFEDAPQVYDPEVVAALVKSINILFPGVSVELNTGEKALILTENVDDVLRPMVVSFRDNSIVDLSLPINKGIQIVDIMKTLDNRYVMDMDTLKESGFLK